MVDLLPAPYYSASSLAFSSYAGRRPLPSNAPWMSHPHPCERPQVPRSVSAPRSALIAASAPSEPSQAYSDANRGYWRWRWFVIVGRRRATVDHDIVFGLTRTPRRLRAGALGRIGIGALLGRQIDFLQRQGWRATGACRSGKRGVGRQSSSGRCERG